MESLNLHGLDEDNATTGNRPGIDTNTLRPYAYMKLPTGTIRILHLYPGQDDARLSGSLHHAVLNSEPLYEALSYAWGSSERTCKFLLDETYYVWITSALHEALRRLRPSRDRRRIWIDAICIDQSNLQERAEQVQLMRQIYQTACQVVCWLGEDDGHAEDVLALLRKISRSSFRTAKHGSISDEFMSFSELPAKESPVWYALVRLFNRPWFQRCWVVQEFVLAQEITMMCGTHAVDWREIDGGVRKLNEHSLPRWAVSYGDCMRRELPVAELTIHDFRTMMTFRKSTNLSDYCYDVVYRLMVGDVTLQDLEAELETGQNIILRYFLAEFGPSVGPGTRRTTYVRLLEAFRDGKLNHLKPFSIRETRFPFVALAFHMRHRQTTDPRDKLFGLLGVTIEGTDAELQPSYTESVGATYTRFTRHLVARAVDSKPLFLLIEAGMHSRPSWSTLDIPSWVYDWTHRPVFEINPLPTGGANQNLYHAARNTQPKVLPPRAQDSPNDLRLVGGFVDRVHRQVTLADWRGERNARGEQIWGLTEDGKIDMSSREAIDDFIKFAKVGARDTAMDLKQFFADVDALVFHRNTTAPKLRTPLGQSSEDALWRTLVADTAVTPQKMLTAASADAGAQYREFRRWLAALETPSTDPLAVATHLVSAEASHWVRTFGNISQFYSLGDTETGFLALVPRCARQGDEIHVLLGTDIPLVLRRVGGGEEGTEQNVGKRYELVGCCYVHGIMQGEFLHDPSWNEEEIVLC